MEELEQKCDAPHEDDKLCGAGISIIIAKTLKGVAQGWESRHSEREMTARTDGGG